MDRQHSQANCADGIVETAYQMAGAVLVLDLGCLCSLAYAERKL